MNLFGKILLFSFFAATTLPLVAEVERITVTWNNVMCNVQCGELIARRFGAMKELEKVEVNPSTGVANLKWNSKFTFSYVPIKTTMQMVGAGIDDVRVRVRGKAKEEGRDVVFYSIGDNTRFLLASPIRPDPRRQVVFPNPTLMQLDPDLRERIMTDAKQDKVLVIEGPLYKPWWSPPLPLMIVIERIQVEKKEQPGKSAPPQRRKV
jgi:hypothetical protein